MLHMQSLETYGWVYVGTEYGSRKEGAACIIRLPFLSLREWEEGKELIVEEHKKV
jgi:hypothetical protein